MLIKVLKYVGVGVAGIAIGWTAKWLETRKLEKDLKTVLEVLTSEEEMKKRGITPEDLVDAMYEEES